MFNLLETPKKSRFRLILAGSVSLHALALALVFANWVWGVALKFGSISFDDGGESVVKLAMLDRSKPLILPPGFYAIAKPPEEVVKPRPPEDAETPDDKKSGDDEGKKDGEPDGNAKADDPKPTGPRLFGTIRGAALKPHLQQIWEAHERGIVPADSFSVTVTCRALADGSLADIRVTKSSGQRLIDETAVNVMREISAQKALAPLSTLSSLSMTLEKDATFTTLSAVGFADDPGDSVEMANQLGLIKMASRFKMRNDDQMALLDGIRISQSGNRLTVSIALPNARAGDMMQRSFGSTARQAE